MATSPLRIRHVDPRTLKADPGNPRTITPGASDRLRKLLDHFGFVEPIVVNAATGEVIGGHQRTRLAIDLGLEKVPAVFLELEEAEALALNVALNNPTAQGTFDPELLDARVAQLEAFDVADLAGFDSGELQSIEVSFTATEHPDVDPILPPAKPTTEPGDVWELGEHLVVCADAFDFDVREMAGGPANMLLTDPPYAIFGSSTGVAVDVADDRMVRPFFEKIARVAGQALPHFGHAYVHCDWRSWSALWEGFRRGGLNVRNMLVWDKGGSGLGTNYANTHELIAFAHQVPKKSGTFDNTRNPDYRAVLASNIIRANRPTGDERLHNAAKPVDLLGKLIENSSEVGGLVLDLFAGSGSTLIAAQNTGRRCLAVDIEPAWCDVIVDRWERLTGQKAVLRARP